MFVQFISLPASDQSHQRLATRLNAAGGTWTRSYSRRLPLSYFMLSADWLTDSQSGYANVSFLPFILKHADFSSVSLWLNNFGVFIHSCQSNRLVAPPSLWLADCRLPFKSKKMLICYFSYANNKLRILFPLWLHPSGKAALMVTDQLTVVFTSCTFSETNSVGPTFMCVNLYFIVLFL